MFSFSHVLCSVFHFDNKIGGYQIKHVSGGSELLVTLTQGSLKSSCLLIGPWIIYC